MSGPAARSAASCEEHRAQEKGVDRNTEHRNEGEEGVQITEHDSTRLYPTACRQRTGMTVGEGTRAHSHTTHSPSRPTRSHTRK
eukprot:7034459-Prymnesium_polylepis.3